MSRALLTNSLAHRSSTDESVKRSIGNGVEDVLERQIASLASEQRFPSTSNRLEF